MKVTKEVLQSQEEKRSKFADLFKREPKEKAYDGKIDLKVTEQEYSYIVNASRIRSGGYKPFIVKAIEEFENVPELIVPKSEDEAKTWFVLNYEEPVKEALKKKAKECGLSLEDFVRALIWTKAKNEFALQKQKEERSQQNLKFSRGYTVQVRLNGDLLKRFEEKYGVVKDHEAALTGVLEILNKDLS